MNQTPFHGELEDALQSATDEPGKAFTARLILVSVWLDPRPIHHIGKETGMHVFIEDDDPLPEDHGMLVQPTVKMTFCLGKCRGCS